MNPNQAANEETPNESATPKGKAKRKAKNATKSETLTLYNLASDIGEKSNLAEKEPERVAAMRAKLAELLKDAVSPGNDQ